MCMVLMLLEVVLVVLEVVLVVLVRMAGPNHPSVCYITRAYFRPFGAIIRPTSGIFLP